MTATARPTGDPPLPSTARRISNVLAAPGLRVDLALAGAAMLLATVVRLPYLWLVPRFTDETFEVLHSLAIVRDGARPLTNYDSYYGALYNYVVAAALLVSGESPLAPRVVVLVAGVLTVGATYGLGRALGESLLSGLPRKPLTPRPPLPRAGEGGPTGYCGAGTLAVARLTGLL